MKRALDPIWHKKAQTAKKAIGRVNIVMRHGAAMGLDVDMQAVEKARADVFFDKHGRRQRIFCSSMADVFDNQVPTEWRDRLWELIRQTPSLDWLLLTKRPQNIAKMKPEFWDEIKGHIWLGATVEHQEAANHNIPHLLKHDSAVRFLSVEPLLGPISFRWASWHPMAGGAGETTDHLDGLRRLDWVITGGESGGRNTSRPANPDWFRVIRDQCEEAGVPFLFKQWGNWNDSQEYHRDKKALGRVLDGITHDGFPDASKAAEQKAPTPQLGNDELVERLRPIYEHYNSINKSFEANHTSSHGEIVQLDNPVFKDWEDTLNAAITALTQPRCDWVKIDDPIVETWKDGRFVDLIVMDPAGNFEREVDCSYMGEHMGWVERHNLPLSCVKVTHAMLPIAPPQEE